ncbi:MAG TPA: prolyl oligopeptidase family serine peptidase [Candidatus Bathyarchaeia archaeon]|nr:prolyl oligopeptidase family serine peptidase [Candidatus Bathyarchaeia archaeon]
MTVTEILQKPVSDKPHFPIESLLSARLLLKPENSGNRIFFLSDMSGVLSLYSMDKNGSIPEPLLPGGQALVNPHIIPGDNFHVVPKLGKILVMIDKLGNENYQPNLVPLDGGIPEPLLGDKYDGEQVACVHFDKDLNIAYFFRDNRKNPDIECLRVNLETRRVDSLGTSIYGNTCNGVNSDHSRVILADGYSAGDVVLYQWRTGWNERKLLYGVPLDQRGGKPVPFTGIGWCTFVNNDQGLLFASTIFHDEGGITYLPLDTAQPVDIPVKGLQHTGHGELVALRNVKDNHFVIEYNIDGSSWAYEATFQSGPPQSMLAGKALVGPAPFSGGVVLGMEWEVMNNNPLQVEYVFSFTRANSPSQLYLIPSSGKPARRISSEKVLGIPEDYLSPGEDASYTSFDGLRVSARLYLPSPKLGYKGARPLVEYVHGGPQGQERPDFTWFSMPLIQYLTLNGFAVFVPNVRGSTGYGMKYMKWVDKDWGGKDVQDHVEGLKRLEKDPRIDSTRRGVVGRSYGGYMTLTLASRHPELWKGAVDMFGPYDLVGWLPRLPPTWQTFFKITLGDPVKDKDFLVERSPKTYMRQLSSPLMIIQGKHDPRVPETESAQLVADLRRDGIRVDYQVYEDEGHDVLRFKNRVHCYTLITDFFRKTLGN